MDKNKIIEGLSKKPINEILSWIIINIDLNTLLSCLKKINPESYKDFIKISNRKNETYPINTNVDNGTIEYIKMGVIEASRNTRIIPLAIFPVKLMDSDIIGEIKVNSTSNKKFVDDQVKRITEKTTFDSNIDKAIRKIKKETNSEYSILFTVNDSDFVEFENLDSFINKTVKSKDYKLKQKDEKINLTSDDVFKYVNNFINIYEGILKHYKTIKNMKLDSNLDIIIENVNYNDKETTIKFMRKPYNKEFDLDYFIVPYMLEFKEDKYQNVYSDRYYKDINWVNKDIFKGNDKKCNLHNTNCALLAYDGNRKEKFLIREYDDAGKSAVKWVNKNELKQKCKCQKPEFYDNITLDPLNETIFMNSSTNGPYYHTRVYGDYMHENFWKNNKNTDLRYVNVGPFKGTIPSRIPKISPEKKKSAFGESLLEFHPRTYNTERSEIDPPLDYLSPIDVEEDVLEKQIKDLSKNLEILKECNFGRNVRCSKTEELQRKAARGNVYLLGARFGENNKISFLSMLFDPKSGWKKDRENRFNPVWMSSSAVKNKVSEGISQRLSSKGMEKFMELTDFVIPEDRYEELSAQFPPVNVNEFGYNIKALKKINKENQGFQLYPLGKNAYLKGKHAGVSATYSQQDSERLELWPQPRRMPNMVPTSQFQFGRSSCFGKSNDWSNDIHNKYTGKKMSGIKTARYGVDGTQGVYGGFTGVGGYPALSDLTMEQGLVPNFNFGLKSKKTIASCKKQCVPICLGVCKKKGRKNLKCKKSCFKTCHKNCKKTKSPIKKRKTSKRPKTK